MFRGRYVARFARHFGSQPTAPRRRLLPRILLAGGASAYAYYMFINYKDAKSKELLNFVPAHQVHLIIVLSF